MLNVVFAALAGASVVRGSDMYLLPRQVPAGPCPTGVHVLAAGGGNGTDPYAYGRLETLAQGIVNAIPGSDMVSVPFNKFNIRNNPTAVPEGNQNLGQYVRDFNGACPETKIVLVGYSAGGIITMNGICTGIINPALADNTVIATVVYGDQTRVAGQPFNVGTCVGAADQSGRLASKRNIAGCAPFAAGLQSYCDINDPECCNGPPEDYAVHLSYSDKYDQPATQFVVSRWNELGSGAAAPSGSSSSSSSEVASSTTVDTTVVVSTTVSTTVVESSSAPPPPPETTTVVSSSSTPTTTTEVSVPTNTETSLQPNDPEDSAHAIFAPFSLMSAAFVASLIFGGAALL